MTLGIMALRLMTLDIIALRLTALCITAFNVKVIIKTTLRFTTLSMMGLFWDTQYK
jgi:hypothetical protein